MNHNSLGINTKDKLSSNVARMGHHVTSGFDFNYDRQAIYYCVDDNDNITHITLEVEDTNTTPVSNGEVLPNGSMTKNLEYDGPLILEALMDAFPETQTLNSFRSDSLTKRRHTLNSRRPQSTKPFHRT